MVPIEKMIKKIVDNGDFIVKLFKDAKILKFLKCDFIKIDDEVYGYELGESSILIVFTSWNRIETITILNISMKRFITYMTTEEQLLLSAENFSFMVNSVSGDSSFQDDRASGVYDNTIPYTSNTKWPFYNDGIIFDEQSRSVVISGPIPLFHTPRGLLITPTIGEDEYFQLNVTHDIPAWDSFIKFIDLIKYQKAIQKYQFDIALHYDGVISEGDLDLFDRAIEIFEGLLSCSAGS